MTTRRQFNLGCVALAFSGLATSVLGKAPDSLNTAVSEGYGPLLPDPDKLLDLPQGFSYNIISKLNDKMSDGLDVPDRADGMGCLPYDNDRVALVRNHELHPKHLSKQPRSIQDHKTSLAYDTYRSGIALPGGTSTLIYNLKTGKVENEYLSLTGTIRNCAGGVTPWGTWLTCEESVAKPDGDITQNHGYVFEVSATADQMQKATPIKAMGRFNHEAAAVDPETGIVYMTEDRGDGLFYRFVPKEYGNLSAGGQLQGLVIENKPGFDSRNWAAKDMPVGRWFDATWIDLDNPESPEDDLRKQGYEKGAAVFARGEGVHWADKELYFCCTNGGDKKLGQIMRYQPGEDKTAGKIQLFLESVDGSLYNFGDNLTVTPQGHLFVCEDQYTDDVENHIRGVTPQGALYTFAKLHEQTELAGACFSPDGAVLFVNVYSPAKTLAIKGPWEKVLA